MATDAFGGWLKERDEDTKGFAYRTPDSWGLIKHFSSEGRFIVLKIRAVINDVPERALKMQKKKKKKKERVKVQGKKPQTN